MSLLVEVIKKRTARGKSANWYRFMGFEDRKVFDMTYRPDVHRRFVIDEIRFRTRRRGSRKTGSALAYEVEQARRWREAILRNPPLLKGFFAEEPEWRDRILSWCEKTLARQDKSKRKVSR